MFMSFVLASGEFICNVHKAYTGAVKAKQKNLFKLKFRKDVVVDSLCIVNKKMNAIVRVVAPECRVLFQI